MAEQSGSNVEKAFLGVRNELRLHRHTGLIFTAQAVVFAVYLKLTGFSVAVANAGGLNVLMLVSCLFLIGVLSALRLHNRGLFHIAIALIFFILSAVLAAGTGQMALAMGFPIVDEPLLKIQNAMGFDTAAYIRALIAIPHAIPVIEFFYNSTVRLTFLLLVALVLTRQIPSLIETTFIYVFSIFVTTATSVFTPAVGIFVHMPSLEQFRSALSPGAGVYHLTLFNGIRDGSITVFDLDRLTGVVTFPSFHTVMALLIAYACRQVRWLFWTMVLVNGLTILAIIPIGGHYVTDMIAGTAVFLFAVAMERRLRRRNTSLDVAAPAEGEASHATTATPSLSPNAV